MNTFLIALSISISINIIVVSLLIFQRLKAKDQMPVPTEELSDFLSDIKIHKYGVVRIDPDAIMYRSPKG